MKIYINKQAVGLKIKQIRLNKGYTLEAFGKLFNTSKSNVLRWEQGLALPNKERLANICKIADITVNELLYGSIDEFLENNIKGLIKESNYPIILTNNELTKMFEKELIDYVLLKLTDYNSYQQGKNLIENLDTFYNNASSFISEYIYNNIVELTELFSEYKEETKEILEKFPTSQDIENFNISKETLEKLCNIDSLNSYLTFIKKDDITKDYLMLKYLYNLVIEKIKSNGFYLQDRITLYITFSNVFKNNIDLHTENFIGFDFIFKENTFILNKYGIDDYNIIIGLKIENENSLYYLANYPHIEKVPLNTEAQYFILNHDNSYLITKITEKPDCKYLAPILGKLE